MKVQSRADGAGHGPRVRVVLRPRLAPGDLSAVEEILQRAGPGSIVTLEGGGGVFCEGAALPIASESAAVHETPFSRFLGLVEQLPVPVVALVDGRCLGGGVGLAAAADLVLATPRATFGLPESLLGLIPAAVLPVLAGRVGLPRARLLALGRAPLTAPEAREWGLVDEVAGDLESAFARHARRFSRMDPRALEAIKRLAAAHFGVPTAYVADATSRLRALLASAETAGRVDRFLAGEAPWTDEKRS